MKPIKPFVLLILASFFLTSCSSDDDGPSIQQLLQQRWFLVSIEYVNPPNIVVFDDCQKNSYFDFGTNNLLVFHSFDGNPCESQEFQAYEYNLTIDNSQIVINNEQVVFLWDIIELTNDSLVLVADNGTTYNLTR